MRTFLLVLLLLGPTVVLATNEPPRRVLKVHPLGFADAAVVAEQARAIVGANGRVTPDDANNRLIVIAAPEQQDQLAALIKELSVPPRNIRIQVRITDAGRSTDRGIGITDVGGNVAVVGSGVKGSVTGRGVLRDQATQSSRDAVQFLTVSSGRRGWINVSQEVPHVEWFHQYGLHHGYLAAGIQWRNVGSRFVVEPRVVGDGSHVQVKLIPELTYLVDNQSVATAFINAATEVTVADGQEFRLGGLAQDNEFLTRFLVGYDRARQQRQVDIVLKPTILQ